MSLYLVSGSTASVMLPWEVAPSTCPAHGRPWNFLLLDRLADRETNVVSPIRYIGLTRKAD
jgi:hypothetical protein